VCLGCGAQRVYLGRAIMVGFRCRPKGKGKRWKKGHSSSSNPETKRHRNVAKSRFFEEHPGKFQNFVRDGLCSWIIVG
jgi:hypothetical protein